MDIFPWELLGYDSCLGHDLWFGVMSVVHCDRSPPVYSLGRAVESNMRTFLSFHITSAFFLDTPHFHCRLGLGRHCASAPLEYYSLGGTGIIWDSADCPVDIIYSIAEEKKKKGFCVGSLVQRFH